MTKNGQNMAKMEKIRNIQMTDNKEDKFFYFPMILCLVPGLGTSKSVKYLISILSRFLFYPCRCYLEISRTVISLAKYH